LRRRVLGSGLRVRAMAPNRQCTSRWQAKRSVGRAAASAGRLRPRRLPTSGGAR